MWSTGGTMKTIWKFPLPNSDTVTIEMPSGAVVLTVQRQDYRPCIWAEVDTEAPMEARKFRVYGTGTPHLETGERYVGTWHSQAFVWHLYELPVPG